MKKLLPLLLIISALFSIQLTNAQCTPDPQYTSPGIYPDTLTNLPHATEGQPYSTTMTQVVPQDTVINFITLTIDSVVLTNFTGFPQNFSYTCDNSNCSWPGGTSGCVLISGNPTVGQAGTYPLTGYVDAYAGGLGVPSSYTVDGYKIVIDAATGIWELNRDIVSVYPNPAKDVLTIKSLKNGSLSVINITGQTINFISVSQNKTTRIDVSNYPSGVYFYQFVSTNGKDIISGKFIKE